MLLSKQADLKSGWTVIADSTLAHSGRVHAALMLLLPSVGTGLALLRSLNLGFQWMDAVAFLSMYLPTSLGVTLGYHRHLAHRAFEAPRRTRAALIILAGMAAQGPPVYWVALHRRHHQHSDEPGDPHSPRMSGDASFYRRCRAFWHAHVGWQFGDAIFNPLVYCPDLLRDRLIRRLNRLYPLWVALGLLLPAIVCAAVAHSVQGAISGFLWGGLVRLFVSYHATNSINSITHMFGARRFATADDSRNTPWLALVTMGEAWHNNHHAFPSSAYFGLRARELDLGALVLRMLRALGLVGKLRRPREEALATYAALPAASEAPQ
jgi:stearoyl-CoA desaturase (Delta-9 desaturase)